MGAWTADLRRAVTDKPPWFGPVLVNCPYHADTVESGAVYPDGFYCFACGAKRSAMHFLADHAGLSLTEDYAAVRALADALPPADERANRQRKPDPAQLEDRVERWQGDPPDRTHWPYWLGRGFTGRTILAAHLCHTGRSFAIPLYGRDGKLFSIKYRRDDALEPDAPKYWTQAGFGQTAVYYPPLRPWRGGPLVLCEGELDALRLAQEGVPAVSVTNGVNSIAGALDQLPDRLVLCLDQDEPGRNGAATVLAALREAGHVATAIEWNPQAGKDVTEAFQNGHGARLLARLRRAYAQVKGA